MKAGGRERQLKELLDALYVSRSPRHLQNDPLSFCHRYPDPRDRELAAVIASSFAYGNVRIILRTLEVVFSAMGSSPRRYVERFTAERGLKEFAGFKHRFNDGRDLCALLLVLRRMLAENGSVERYFMQFHAASATDVGAALNGYCAAVQAMDLAPVFGAAGIPSDSYFRFLFPSPASGSACKRLCMFLRWVVRPDDGIDLGLWRGVLPAQLIIPVDTHISRISRYLGFTSRTAADWRMACEITARLRDFDPVDPVRYDFALAHLGISEGCDGRSRERCRGCRIGEICLQGRINSGKKPV